MANLFGEVLHRFVEDVLGEELHHKAFHDRIHPSLAALSTHLHHLEQTAQHGVVAAVCCGRRLPLKK